jgi:hypothetical protein
VRNYRKVSAITTGKKKWEKTPKRRPRQTKAQKDSIKGTLNGNGDVRGRPVLPPIFPEHEGKYRIGVG